MGKRSVENPFNTDFQKNNGTVFEKDDKKVFGNFLAHLFRYPIYYIGLFKVYFFRLKKSICALLSHYLKSNINSFCPSSSGMVALS